MSAVAIWGQRLSEHPGVINLNDQAVDVSVEIEPDRIRLSAGTEEIGYWPLGECEIVENGSGVFLIRAEHDELPFAPAEPERLRESIAAVGLSDSVADASGVAATTIDDNLLPHLDEEPIPADVANTVPERVTVGDLAETIDPVEQPPPGRMTLALFYLLAAITALLGIWALSTLI